MRKWNKKTKLHFEKELKKLQRMNPQVGEYGVRGLMLKLFRFAME